MLVECIEVDSETFRVSEGDVLYHSADMGIVYSKLLEIRPKEYTIEYIGELPGNLKLKEYPVVAHTLPYGRPSSPPENHPELIFELWHADASRYPQSLDRFRLLCFGSHPVAIAGKFLLDILRVLGYAGLFFRKAIGRRPS